jgi:hypothetical protein
LKIFLFRKLLLKDFLFTFSFSGKTEFQTLEENKKRLTRTERTFIRTRTSRFTRQTVPIPHINNLMLSTNTTTAANSPSGTQYKLANGTNNKLVQTNPSATHTQHRPYESFSHKIQSTESPSRIPRNAWVSVNK